MLAVGLTVFGLVENSKANGKYAEAGAMKQPGGQLKAGEDPARFSQLSSDGDSARTMSTVGFVGAGVSAATTVLFGILAGGIGPIRF